MQLIGAPAGIKSIQRGTAFLNGVGDLTVAISSVNLSKAEVVISHRAYVAGTGSSDLSALQCSAKFNSATQLYIARSSNSGHQYVEWVVKEYV